MYDNRYEKKKPQPIEGIIIAPKDPLNSAGEYYFTIKGTNELNTPTQNPCMNLPSNKVPV